MRRLISGKSVQGRNISLYLFGPEATPLKTLYIGVFHGDEPMSGQLMEKFIQDCQHQNWTMPFGILPVLNPDGLAANTRVNANGTDLNRNYPTKNWKPWEKLTDEESSNRNPDYHPGQAPASEPETKIIVDLLEEYRPQSVITVHQPYKVLNFDGPAENLARAMARHNGYEVVASIGYPTPGSFGTYAGIERNIPVVTLELPGDDIAEPFDQVWADNRDALLAALEF